MAILNLIEKSVDCCFAFLPRKKPDKNILSEVCLIAHRGAHDKKLQLIENTDAAFQRALALGCWGIELDVHATADGVLVVNHDPTLTRLWGKALAIRELTFTALRKLVPTLPSLAEVVYRYGKQVHLFIELKAPFTQEAALFTTLASLTPSVDYHLLSLNESIFASCSKLPREVMLLVAAHNNVSQFCQLSLKRCYAGVLGHYLLLNNNKIKQLRSANQRVGVGLVDSKFGLYRELNRGLHWVFSDNVSLLRSCLQELQATETRG